jgi:hypothetical protein
MIGAGLAVPSLGQARRRRVLTREAVEHRNRDPRRPPPVFARCDAVEDRRAKAPRVFKVALGRRHAARGEICRRQPTDEIVGRAQPLEATPPPLAHRRQKVKRQRARTERELELPRFDVVEHSGVQRHDTTITSAHVRGRRARTSSAARASRAMPCPSAIRAVLEGGVQGRPCTLARPDTTPSPIGPSPRTTRTMWRAARSAPAPVASSAWRSSTGTCTPSPLRQRGPIPRLRLLRPGGAGVTAGRPAHPVLVLSGHA